MRPAVGTAKFRITAMADPLAQAAAPPSKAFHPPDASADAGEARLRLFQLVSPALPVGAFSYSEGLEWLVQNGQLADGAAVHAWLEAEYRAGALAIEAASLPLLREALWRACGGDAEAALEARGAVQEWQGWLLAQREAPELRAQQRQMGGSLCQLLADLGWSLPAGVVPLAWPAAWAWAGVCLEIPPVALVEAYLYAWTASQLSAAVRLVPLGPTEAQRLQLALAPTLVCRARELAASDPRTLWNGGVGAGLAQLGHGELYSRLFRS
jgi:urease accessory protein